MSADGFVFTVDDARRIKRVVDLAENQGRSLGIHGGSFVFDSLLTAPWDGFCNIRGNIFQMDMTQRLAFVVVHFDGTAPTWSNGPMQNHNPEFEMIFRTSDIVGGLYV